MDNSAHPESEPDRPPDEAWWQRELHRSEKMVDRYMSLLGDNPDLLKAKAPWELDPDDPTDEAGAPLDPELTDPATTGDPNPEVGTDTDPAAAVEDDTDAMDDFDDEPHDNEGYPEIARLARAFAVHILELADRKETSELLRLSACRIGANLAGGHGLGYDEDTLCGNIVKCRWALADCEFCWEMLDQLARRTSDPVYADLREHGAALGTAIRDRITRLRARVWW